MILAIHLLTGAAIVLKIKFLPLALLLAFLSHYLLDSLPHWEYSIENIKERKWKNSFREFLKIALDLSLGVFLVFLFSEKFSLALLGGLTATLADSFTFLSLIFSHRLLEIGEVFHQKFHFPKNKKISPLWGILAQIIIIFLAILFLVQ